MTYSACNVDIHLSDEETESDREEWDNIEYDDWITDHYSELADFYQQISDEEEALRHDRIVQEYEFQTRGGFLPGDSVMAEVEPGCWSRSTVLLVGVTLLVVVTDQSMMVQVALQMNAWWLN